MRVEVTQSDFSATLSRNEPSVSVLSDGIGLACLLIVLLDMLSVVGLGSGVTGLVTGLIPLPETGAIMLAVIAVIVIDGALLFAAASRLMGSRWLAAYRRVFGETLALLRDLPGRLAAPDDKRDLLLTAALGGLGLILGFYVFALFNGASWLGRLGGSQWIVRLAALLFVPAIALIVAVVGKTARRERSATALGVCITAVAWLVVATASEPLATLFAREASRQSSIDLLSAWTALAFGIAIGVMLMLGFDSEEDSLHLHLKWTEGGAAGGPPSLLVHNPSKVPLHRRALLTIDSHSSQLLLVTSTAGSQHRTVNKISQLGESGSIDLNKTAFAVWDLKAAGQVLLGPPGGAPRAALSDPNNLISFSVQPFALPSTAGLSRPLELDEKAYQYVTDHIFLSPALAAQMDLAIARAVEANTKALVGTFDLAKTASDWKADMSSLAIVEETREFSSFDPLYRTPAVFERLKAKTTVAVRVRNRIQQEVAKLGQINQSLERISSDIRNSVSKFFVSEIDLLLAADSGLSAEQRENIRAIVRLFNFSANPTLASSERLNLLQQEGVAVVARLADDLKEVEADLKQAQGEIFTLFQTLMAKQFLTPPERQFISHWHQLGKGRGTADSGPALPNGPGPDPGSGGDTARRIGQTKPPAEPPENSPKPNKWRRTF
ncbi:MAG: hypothetical protein WDN24_10590 [Sphingomonas sp.]